eukprot:GHVH01003978.1.p1 GENE.GHVH01003978.1~~GHVH01003978.1.p1  ORF type:complete len:194 (+),score=14.54 GHVH01003978.1:68-649(+)
MAPSKKHMEILMLTISAIGLLNCISRSDYNFPVYAALYLIFFNVPDDFLPKPDHDHKALKKGVLCRVCYPNGVDGRTGKPLTSAEIDFYNHEANFSNLYHTELMMKSKRFRQQRFMCCFMFCTILADLLWLGYWPFIWSGSTWRTLQWWSVYQHSFVVAMSCVNLFLKVHFIFWMSQVFVDWPSCCTSDTINV